MTMFLRNKDNVSLCEVECFIDGVHLDIRSVVCLKEYSQFLLSIENIVRRDGIIKDFLSVSELRGWLWERYFEDGENTSDEYDRVLTILRTKLKKISEKYNLNFAED